MVKRMGYKELLFILPTLLLIGIFSLWPIVQSFVYTFFDYRLNDQQKAGLYITERFNTDLFQETALYISMFLDEDKKNITDPADLKKVNQTIQRLDQLANTYQGKDKVITISAEEKKEITTLYEDMASLVTALNEKYRLSHKDDLPVITEDIKNSIIPSNFIGLNGYAKALSDKRIGIALWNTVFFTVVSVFFELLLGLGLALIMNKAIFGKGFIRTTSLIPWAIPTAVAALMWSYMYDGTSGIMSNLFQWIGLVHDSRDLLLTSGGAMFSAIFADVWKTTPYMALLLLAGLQNISGSLYEAASIDGAGRVQSFFRITLPLLRPSILVALLFRTLDAFRVFDLIYVLTRGGPGGSTETLSVYSYKVMFSETNFGYGSVIVMLMFVFVALIAIFYVKLLGANLMEKN